MCKSKDASLSCSSISFLACGSMLCRAAGCAVFNARHVIGTVVKHVQIACKQLVSDLRSRGLKLSHQARADTFLAIRDRLVDRSWLQKENESWRYSTMVYRCSTA